MTKRIACCNSSENTLAQWAKINKAIQYGQSQGVTVKMLGALMNNSSRSNISVSQAREIATQLASCHLTEFLSNASVKLLRDMYLEAENCWMFFKNEEIVIPPKYTLSHFAYCVGKKGISRSVPDFSDDPIRLQKYLKDMSDYFAQNDL